MAAKEITISVENGQIVVEPYGADISKGKGETVTWKGKTGALDWVVCFGEDSPFQHRHFFKGRKDSGMVKEGLQGLTADKYYKYTIEAEGYTLDPGIIVRP